jgi:hypothetical protein
MADFIMGVDLGQARDRTAAVVIERVRSRGRAPGDLVQRFLSRRFAEPPLVLEDENYPPDFFERADALLAQGRRDELVQPPGLRALRAQRGRGADERDGDARMLAAHWHVQPSRETAGRRGPVGARNAFPRRRLRRAEVLWASIGGRRSTAPTPAR